MRRKRPDEAEQRAFLNAVLSVYKKYNLCIGPIDPWMALEILPYRSLYVRSFLNIPSGDAKELWVRRPRTDE